MQKRKNEDFFVSLKPLKKAKALRKVGFYTFDCETKDGLIGKEMFCWGLGYKQAGGKNFLTALQGKTDLKPLFDKLAEWKDKTHYKIVYIHNLTFDARFLIHYMAHNDIEYYPIVSGSNMLALIIESMRVKFVDTVQYLKTSQEKAEIEWLVDKNLRKIDCSDIFEKKYEEWTNEEKERVFEHNKNDVMALHQIMWNFRETMFKISHVDVLTTISLAGISMKSFRKEMKSPMLNPFVYKRINKETRRFYLDYDDIAERFVRESYYGGRNEVYNRNLHKNRLYIDKVSMYPWCMVSKLYPAGSPVWAKNNKRDKKELMDIIKGKDNRLAIISVKVKPNKDEYYPTLPKRINGRVMFTNCEYEAVYTSVELQYAYKRGYRFEIIPIDIQSIHKENQWVRGVCGLVFPDKQDYFVDFVSKFFKIKKESVGGKRQASKILLNSAYGKFGEQFMKKSPIVHYFTNELDAMNYISFHENPKSVYMRKNPESKLWITIELEDSKKVKPFMNISIATFITAYARLELLEQMHKFEEQNVLVDYCDTDSLTIDENVKCEYAKVLGSWDIEQRFDEVKFLAPKAYISIKQGKPFLKLKGVDRKKIEEIVKTAITIEDIEKMIRKPIEMAERYMNFKESHRHGLILNSKKLCKHYSFENQKRNFNKGGFSIPWTNETLPEKFLIKINERENLKIQH